MNISNISKTVLAILGLAFVAYATVSTWPLSLALSCITLKTSLAYSTLLYVYSFAISGYFQDYFSTTKIFMNLANYKFKQTFLNFPKNIQKAIYNPVNKIDINNINFVYRELMFEVTRKLMSKFGIIDFSRSIFSFCPVKAGMIESSYGLLNRVSIEPYEKAKEAYDNSGWFSW